MKVRINHRFCGFDVTHVDRNLETVEWLYEAGQMREVRAVLDSNGRVCAARYRVAIEEMVEDAVAVIQDVGHLQVMVVLAEYIVNAALDLKGVKCFSRASINTICRASGNMGFGFDI